MNDRHADARQEHSRNALRMKMHESAQQMTDSWGTRSRASTAQAAMEEIPNRVGEDMYKVASHVVDNVQREVAAISMLVRERNVCSSQAEAEQIVKRLAVIPTMVHNLLEARVEKAKATVRHRVRGMIQTIHSMSDERRGNSQETIAAQMRMISTEVEKAAAAAVEQAAQECQAHANRQLDFALS